jgi:hypothetical protein
MPLFVPPHILKKRTCGGAISAARADVLGDGGCSSRAAPQRFTTDGPLRGHKRRSTA